MIIDCVDCMKKPGILGHLLPASKGSGRRCVFAECTCHFFKFDLPAHIRVISLQAVIVSENIRERSHTCSFIEIQLQLTVTVQPIREFQHLF